MVAKTVQLIMNVISSPETVSNFLSGDHKHTMILFVGIRQIRKIAKP